MRHLAALFLPSIFLAACVTQVKSGDVLLVDDFSSPDSGFTSQSDADAITEYVDGQYKIEVFTPHLNVWSVAGPQLTDSIVEVNAHTAGGTQNNLYGVICRHQDDDNFYFFAISADGYYAIGKLKDGDIVMLSSQVFEHSDRIITGQAANHVAARCAVHTLSLIVNGSKLAEVTDEDFTEGKVGLIVGTFDDAPTDVRFDDLLVTQP